MEINDSSKFVFGASRLFGYAPYIIKRNKLGKITSIKLSIVLCIYSGFIWISLGKSLVYMKYTYMFLLCIFLFFILGST